MSIERGRSAQDIAAEQAVLAACLQSPAALAEARSVMGGSEFFQPRHTTMFTAMCDLADAGKTVDPMVLLADLQDRGELVKVGGAPYLHTVFSATAVPANVGFYCDRVKVMYRQRRAGNIGETILQVSEDVAPDDLQETLAALALELTLLVDETDTVRPVEGLSSWGRFMEEAPDPQAWIVPNLIEKQDVVMVLGGPGAGKSWLSRQVALCVAAGVHPFKPSIRIHPRRTLLVDLENPPSAVRRQADGLYVAVEQMGVPVGDRGHIWRFPEGLNIRKHADAMMLERVVAETRPELVCLGSLYNAYQRGRDDWDTAAEEVKAVFNRLRQRYGVALWLEHHMPRGADGKGTGNPFGSTVWERWPGFGRVLERVGENAYWLKQTFRQDRDDNRDFPVGLYRGGQLPWSSIWDFTELEAAADRQLA